MFTQIANKWLENALDYGITEQDFWNMTLLELERAIESKKRMQRVQAREKATFDYILADLIGRSIGRLHSSSAKLPAINEAYPSLFDSQEIEEQKAARKAKLFAAQLRQFAQSHNDKLKKEVAKASE